MCRRRSGSRATWLIGQYWRDSRDRITAWQRGTDNSINGKEVGNGNKFQYDAEGQLTDAWYLAQDPGGNMHSPYVEEHFQYDQLGNRSRGGNG